jgi:predicted AlkP superfamily phosphohydrolase/phosphomutase
MKILVIGLSIVSPEILLGTERLENIHRLIEYGAYGWLQSSPSSNLFSSWLSLVTSREIEPGDLDRVFDKGIDTKQFVSTKFPSSGEHLYIWDQIQSEGKDYILVSDPLSVNQKNDPGITIGSLLDASLEDTGSDKRALIKDEITSLVGEYPVDVSIEVGIDQNELVDQIYSMSHKQFQVVRHLIATREWGYFQFVEIGLQRIHQLFSSRSNASDEVHLEGEISAAITDYYVHLDQEIGEVLDLLTDDTILLLIAPVGMFGKEGMFTMLAANTPLSGEVQGARLIDIAPTMLDLGGYQIPDTMQGKSLVLGLTVSPPDVSELSQDEEAILRERLSGLGYL